MLVGTIHISLSIFFIYYSLYFPYKYDKYIFSFILLICLNWLCLNGECIISYLYKKHNIQNYKLGTSPTELTDIDDFSIIVSKHTKINKKIIDNLLSFIMFLGVLSIFYRIIRYKTISPFYIVYLNILAFIIYSYISKKKDYKFNNIYEKIYSIIIIISLVTIYNKNKNFI